MSLYGETVGKCADSRFCSFLAGAVIPQGNLVLRGADLLDSTPVPDVVQDATLGALSAAQSAVANYAGVPAWDGFKAPSFDWPDFDFPDFDFPNLKPWLIGGAALAALYLIKK